MTSIKNLSKWLYKIILLRLFAGMIRHSPPYLLARKKAQ
jgi:hypothetical protein